MLWTQEEVDSYRQVENQALTGLYSSAGISNTNPEERAKYLAETFLGLTMTDHYITMRKAKKDGKSAALNFLEEIAIEQLN